MDLTYDNIKISDLKMEKRICKYGSMRGFIVKYKNIPMFLKYCQRVNFLDKEYKLLRFLSEKYPNKFLRYYKILENGFKQKYLLMDYCSYKTLELKIDNLEPEVVLRWIKNTLQILLIIHQEGYYHGDIKSDNLFMGPNGESYIIDFEFTNKKNDPFSGWSPVYCAPEVKIGYKSIDNNHGEKADIWGLGVSLYELITGDVPWDDEDFECKELHLPVKRIEWHLTIDAIIHDCLKLNPNDRPGINDLLDKYFST